MTSLLQCPITLSTRQYTGKKKTNVSVLKFHMKGTHTVSNKIEIRPGTKEL